MVREKIECEFKFCIYQKDKKCVLDGITVSNMGYCDSAIIPELPPEYLERYKQEILEKFANIHVD